MVPQPRIVAALVTKYRRWTRTDFIAYKIRKGYDHAGNEVVAALRKTGPNLDIRDR